MNLTHISRITELYAASLYMTPEENGMSECLNHSLLKQACMMLLAADLLKFLWAESVQHVTWLKNCTLTCALSRKTPFEMLHKSKPNLEDLPEWGTRIFVLCKGCNKLDEKADGWL